MRRRASILMAVLIGGTSWLLATGSLVHAAEKPASTDGEPNGDLLEEAQNHAQYQAEIRLQGHHFWQSRFQRIVARLPGGVTARTTK